MRIQKISGGSIKKFAITIKIIDNKKKNNFNADKKVIVHFDDLFFRNE